MSIEAMKHYEAALLKAFPYGASGDVFDHWNKARQAITTEESLAEQEPKRKPLTDDQIYEMYNEPRSDAEMLAFARAIEAAHGIKE